jgi:hypothetical protein
VLRRVKEERIIQHTIKRSIQHIIKRSIPHTIKKSIQHTIMRKKANRTGHGLRSNCLLKHVIEGRIEGKLEVIGRSGGRRKQLLDDLKTTRGNWKLKEEALA